MMAMNMIELMIIAAFLGVLISGIWDLFTTEIPDEIPTLMAFAGVFGWLLYSKESLVPLFYSIVLGTLILIIGWTMYKLGQWGGGDAKLLAAVVYMVPLFDSRIFAFDFAINLFITGAAYILIYSLAVGIKNPKSFSLFKKDLKENKKMIGALLLIFLSLSVTMIAISWFSLSYIYYPAILMFFVMSGLLLFWRYGIVIENKIFKKRIAVSKLRVGDVVESSKRWDGATASDIKYLQKRKKYVTIKEGVRFGPAFSIAFIFTVFYGNLIWLLI